MTQTIREYKESNKEIAKKSQEYLDNFMSEDYNENNDMLLKDIEKTFQTDKR